jgi:hypothetical protein
MKLRRARVVFVLGALLLFVLGVTYFIGYRVAAQTTQAAWHNANSINVNFNGQATTLEQAMTMFASLTIPCPMGQYLQGFSHSGSTITKVCLPESSIALCAGPTCGGNFPVKIGHIQDSDDISAVALYGLNCADPNPTGTFTPVLTGGVSSTLSVCRTV